MECRTPQLMVLCLNPMSTQPPHSSHKRHFFSQSRGWHIFGFSPTFRSAHELGNVLWGGRSKEWNFVWWKSCEIPVLVVVSMALDHGNHAPLFIIVCSCLCTATAVRWLQQRLCGPWSLKYVLWSYSEKLADPRYKHWWAEGSKWGPLQMEIPLRVSLKTCLFQLQPTQWPVFEWKLSLEQ